MHQFVCLRRLPTVASRTQRRCASHQAQGRANGAKDGPGKRLGAKKTAGQYVVTGNILFKQRGVMWKAGENCFMGRDHTIHAGAPGYVRYYQDPIRAPGRKLIGVVFNKEDTLPTSPQAARKRRLGMLAYTMEKVPKQESVEESQVPTGHLPLALRPAYRYKVPNYLIGRKITERPVAPFRPGNRLEAWRARTVRKEKAIAAKALRQGGKKKVRKTPTK